MKKWIYRHYKWWLYEVIGTWFHSENQEEFVIYKMLYETKEYPIWTIWIRPKPMFLENIEIEWSLVSRFTYIWWEKYKWI